MRFFSSSLKNLWVLAALLPLATGLACGKQAGHVRVMPVHGRVFWRGKPLANALVILHPQNTAELAGLRPLAHADQTGSFELTTYDEGDGAPAGDYAVTIEWRRPARGEDRDPPRNELPVRYSRPDSTPLHVTIDDRTTELPVLEVQR